jgi:hypothetical protein
MRFGIKISLMLEKLIYPVILILLMLNGCADDGSTEVNETTEPETPKEEQDSTIVVDSTFHECDSFISERMGIGTACCISGYVVANPGDTANYRYHINHQDAMASWLIIEGDMSILKGKESTTVTVIMGPEFTGGILQALGSGYKESRLICNDRLEIKKR